MMPRVTVVVPHYQDPVSLDLCLAALDRQTHGRANFDVVVADNASPMGEAAVAAVIAGRARLVICAERGAGPARNAGVAASTGEVIAFTDSDCIPEPAWLEQGLAALTGYDMVGGGMKVLVGDPDHMTPTEAFEVLFAFDNATYVQRKGFSVTANLLCNRPVFTAVGPFHSAVSEDIDWCHRARDAGFRLGYAPKAVVGHPARRTWAELLAKSRRLNGELWSLHRKTGGSALGWIARCAVLPLSAVAHTARVFTTSDLSGAATRLGAVGVLYRLRFWRAWNGVRLAVTQRGA